MKLNNKIKNTMKLALPSLSVNEGMARAAVAAFCSQLDPATTDLADIKCAVSEAVTNCIVHAYKDTVGTVYITVKLIKNGYVQIEIRDRGCGIPNVQVARQPLYTTDAESERSGLGFTVMESFCDKVKVRSRQGVGTTVVLIKKISHKGLDDKNGEEIKR